MRCIHDHLEYDQKYVKSKNLTKSRISRDEKDVKSVYNVLSEVFIPPFSEQPQVSISTGIVVAESEADKIMQTYVNGKTAMQSFIDKRLSNNPKASFFDPIKKMKTPGFTVSKTKVCKTNSKIVSIETSNQLFSKISIISQKRNIDMKMLLTCRLGCVPLSLAEADASLRKRAKSVLLHKIEGNVELISIPKNCACIIDGMAALRQLPIPKLTYRELANRLLETILTAGKNAKRIGVVFDIYTKNSINDTERNRRSKGSLQLQQIVPTSVIIVIRNRWSGNTGRLSRNLYVTLKFTEQPKTLGMTSKKTLLSLKGISCLQVISC